MKKIFVITTCVFIVFNSCKKEAAFSEASKQGKVEQDKITNSQARALVIDQRLDFPGPFDLTNQCSGETVTVTGTLSDHLHILINGSTMNLSDNFRGQLKGTGSLGNAYVSNQNENVALNGIPFGAGLFVIEDITFFRMVSTSGAPDFTVRRNAHLTVTANGVVTVDRVDLEVTCRG